MKTLQSNFTTPEQSKRLLQLGVPADSADCYFGSYGGHPDYVAVRQTEFELEDDALFRLNDNLLPCWSVGRLIDILAICCKNPMFYIHRTLIIESGMVDYCMMTFANSVKLKIIDFSKLED